MKRYTISLEDSIAEQFEDWIKRNRYTNRSEALRDLLRERFAQEALRTYRSPNCVASVTYVYDHHERELGRRLVEDQHKHHELTVSTLHVHLDHEHCLEVALLRGNTKTVLAEAREIIAERGVQHGNIHIVPVEAPHTHPHD